MVGVRVGPIDGDFVGAAVIMLGARLGVEVIFV